MPIFDDDDKGNARILFSAEVNGQTRTVQLDPVDCTDWSIAWATHGTQGGVPDADDLDSLEMLVMNNEYYYSIFYEDASYDDYNAEVINRTAEVI